MISDSIRISNFCRIVYRVVKSKDNCTSSNMSCLLHNNSKNAHTKKMYNKFKIHTQKQTPQNRNARTKLQTNTQ